MSDIRMRLAQARADIDKVSDFLLATYRLTHDKHNWELRRWHGWCYYGETDQWEQQCQQVALWETLTGELVAVMHPENQGTAFFETHPDYRYLEAEMLAWAEKHLSAVRDEKAYLEIAVEDSDSQRQALLQQKGYHALDYHYFSRWQDLNQILPEPVLPAGYAIRSLKDEDADIARLMTLINAAFGHQHTVTMYRNFMQAPCYRLDLDEGCA